MSDKPFAESCVQNRAPILAVLREVFADRRRVLEIGSGTGQHAVYFGAELPHLVWQTADVPQQHPGIRQWLDAAALPNVLPPIALDVSQTAWRNARYDAAFSANTLHIMGWPEVEQFFEASATCSNRAASWRYTAVSTTTAPIPRRAMPASTPG